MSTWPTPQPIETAKKDGRDIIGWDPEYKVWCRMYWDGDDSAWVLADAQHDGATKPTYWLPMPPAPERKP